MSEKLRMAKAELRADGPHAFPAGDLLREIARLYEDLQAIPGEDHRRAQRPAYLDLEAQIRTLAARHWVLTSGLTIGHTGRAAPPDVGGLTRRYFRTMAARRPIPDPTIASLLGPFPTL